MRRAVRHTASPWTMALGGQVRSADAVVVAEALGYAATVVTQRWTRWYAPPDRPAVETGVQWPWPIPGWVVEVELGVELECEAGVTADLTLGVDLLGTGWRLAMVAASGAGLWSATLDVSDLSGAHTAIVAGTASGGEAVIASVWAVAQYLTADQLPDPD